MGPGGRQVHTTTTDPGQDAPGDDAGSQRRRGSGADGRDAEDRDWVRPVQTQGRLLTWGVSSRMVVKLGRGMSVQPRGYLERGGRTRVTCISYVPIFIFFFHRQRGVERMLGGWLYVLCDGGRGEGV